MELKIYSIYDKAAKAFTQPFFMHNKGLAIRAFSDNVNSEQENNISKHPEQFLLYEMGQWDDVTGVIIPYSDDKRELLGTGLDFKQETETTDLINEIRELKKLLKEQN